MIDHDTFEELKALADACDFDKIERVTIDHELGVFYAFYKEGKPVLYLDLSERLSDDNSEDLEKTMKSTRELVEEDPNGCSIKSASKDEFDKEINSYINYESS